MAFWGIVWLWMWLEILLTLLLVLPLPLALKRTLIDAITTNVTSNSRVRSVLVVIFIFTLLMAIEAYREFADLAKEADGLHGAKEGHGHAHMHVMEDLLHATEKLYSAGIASFLFLVLYGLSSTMTQLARVESRAAAEQKQARGSQDAYLKLCEDNEKLRADLKALRDDSKDAARIKTSSEALQKQALQQQTAFGEMMDRNRELEATIERLRDQLAAKSSSDKKNE